MGKSFHNDVFDLGLQQISNNTNWGGSVLNMSICRGQPTTVGQANTQSPGGLRHSDEISIDSGDVTLEDRPGGGRQARIAAQTGSVTVDLNSLVETATATAGGASTLDDTNQSWTANEHVGRALRIVSGTGAGQVRDIASNSATQITVATAWTTQPDATSVYEIRENLHIAFYDAGGSPRLLAVTNETSDQSLTNGNPINIPETILGMADPV